MAYKQTNNPLSRKTSPLRVDPFAKKKDEATSISPGVVSIEDPAAGGTSMHEGEKPIKLEGQPMPEIPYEELSDMEESGVEQPDYEAISRKSSSPLNKHSEIEAEIKAAKAKWDKEQPEGDFYETYAHLYEAKTKAEAAHKGEEKKNSPANMIGISHHDAELINEAMDNFMMGKQTAKSKGVVDASGREGSNRQERKKRRQERRNIKKDKTLSASQKKMALKESRQQQRDNVRGVEVKKENK